MASCPVNLYYNPSTLVYSCQAWETAFRLRYGARNQDWETGNTVVIRLSIQNACFLKGDARMVNEEEVLKLVDHDRMNTELLREFFDVSALTVAFDDATLSSSDSFFNLGAISGHTHAATGGSFVTPVDTTESFDLFKIQDEESMDTLDSTKEPPMGW